MNDGRYVVNAFLDYEDSRPNRWYCQVNRNGGGKVTERGGFDSREDALKWGRKQAQKAKKANKPGPRDAVTEYI